MVRLEGLEPPISNFVGLHSIQLNYSRICNYYKIFSLNFQGFNTSLGEELGELVNGHPLKLPYIKDYDDHWTYGS